MAFFKALKFQASKHTKPQEDTDRLLPSGQSTTAADRRPATPSSNSVDLQRPGSTQTEDEESAPGSADNNERTKAIVRKSRENRKLLFKNSKVSKIKEVFGHIKGIIGKPHKQDQIGSVAVLQPAKERMPLD